MKKLYILLLLAFLTACSTETEQPVTEVVEETTEEVVEIEETVEEEPVEEVKESTLPAMPELPDIDFTDLDFFDDGYTLTELVSCTDGDTAVFKVNGVNLATRFLAVDTPETNNGVDPWGFAAKEYTCDALTNAQTIILENDEESDLWDSYDRLLAWIWVDGELLQFKLVEESLAWVKYLYGDYKYNITMIQLENAVQKNDKKIWGENDPDYNYESTVLEVSLSDIRDVANIGDTVTTRGIITGIVGSNAFIQNDEGAAIYIYTGGKSYNAIKNYGVGTYVELTAIYKEYNGLIELMDMVDSTILILEENVEVPEPLVVTLNDLNEYHESRLIKVENVTIESIEPDSGTKGYNVIVRNGEWTGAIRIDKYLNPFIEESYWEVGKTINITGNLGQYQDTYQIMIRTTDDVEAID